MGSGSSSGNGSSSVFVSYALPIVDPSALGPRALIIDAVTLPGGAWRARRRRRTIPRPRPLAQRIPHAARLLDIRTVFASRVLRWLTVTRSRRCARIAAVVDGARVRRRAEGDRAPVPAVHPGGPRVTFTFRAGATRPALAAVPEPADTPRRRQPMHADDADDPRPPRAAAA